MLLPFFQKEETMARTIGLITELEIINSVLRVAGDNPVQSLDENYQPVFIIRQMINDVSRDMQNKNYWFNTEYGVELESNTVTDTITLPFNILNFEPEDDRYVARGLSVYDREDRTTTITDTITADISVMLEFDELPQAARNYIQAKCRLDYNNEYFGGQENKRSLEKEENTALQLLDKLNIENEDVNMFQSSRAINIAFRNRRI